MKRRWIIFLLPFIVILFSIYSLPSASGNSLTWFELSEKHELKLSEIIQENSNLQKLFLYPEGNFDAEETLNIIERINRLPEDLLGKLADNHIKIQLFTGDLTDNAGARHLEGTTPRGYLNQETTWDDVPGMGGSRIVYVKIGASEKGNGHSSVNLELHELAHTIDQIVYGGIRDNEEFLTIWEKEVDHLFPDQAYFQSFPEEYFAEAFAMFFLNEEEKATLKHRAPLTYIFIENL